MRRLLLIAAALATISGCGTITAFQNSPTTPAPYQGVKQDLKEVGGSMSDGKVGRAGLHLLDTPLSAIGDTLALPVTLPAAIKKNDQ